MQRYRMRPQDLDAIQFDGTSSGVEAVVAWMAAVAPDILVRPRTEYRGWEDSTGYLELEVRGIEQGCCAGDWILISDVDGRKAPWFVDELTFGKYYEPVA